MARCRLVSGVPGFLGSTRDPGKATFGLDIIHRMGRPRRKWVMIPVKKYNEDGGIHGKFQNAGSKPLVDGFCEQV